MFADREQTAASWQLTTTQSDRERVRRLLAILKPGAPPQIAASASK
jgi:hypothetical protein